MNKNIKLKIIIFICVLSVVAFPSFLVTALVTREYDVEYYYVFLIPAFIFMVTLFVSAWVISHFEVSGAEIQEYRFKKLDKKREIYSLVINDEITLENLIRLYFPNYKKESIGEDFILYDETARNYKKRLDVFYFPVCENFSLNYDDEMNRRKEFLRKVNNLFFGQYEAINCLVIRIHHTLDMERIQFYRNFIGFRDGKVERGTFYKLQVCSDFGIDAKTGNVYFYQSKFIDSGVSADLSWLIKKQFKLKRTNL